MTEVLPVRVVKVVQSVMPRRLTASDVIDALPDDKSGNVYATLSNLSKDGKGPLHKKRGESGVLDYGITPDFDISDWLKARENGRRASRAPSMPAEPVGDDAAQIISVLQRFPTRLTSNDIEAAGVFADRRVMLLALAQMCAPDGPLERDRTGNGAPFMYGIRRDFDVEAWLADRGEELPQLKEPATASVNVTTAPSKEGAGPVAAAAPMKPEPVAARAAQPAMTARPEPAEGSRNGAPSGKHADGPAPGDNVRPAPAAAKVNGESHGLAVELVVIAAANLAAELRRALAGDSLPDMPELASALHNFERADRLYVSTKARAQA